MFPWFSRDSGVTEQSFKHYFKRCWELRRSGSNSMSNSVAVAAALAQTNGTPDIFEALS
jgi:hypothetical protein